MEEGEETGAEVRPGPSAVVAFLIAAFVIAASTVRGGDEVRLGRLSPATGEVNGARRDDGPWPPELDGDNSVRAEFYYRLESIERAEINIDLDGVDRQFVTGVDVLEPGEGSTALRFTAICGDSSDRRTELRRITYSLAEVDEEGNWVRALAVGVRSVDYEFLCPEDEGETR